MVYTYVMDWILILGLAAGTLTAFAGLPQLIKSIKSKSTTDLSLGMFAAITLGVFLWMIYGIMTLDTPLVLANGITLVISGSILGLKIKHK